MKIEKQTILKLISDVIDQYPLPHIEMEGDEHEYLDYHINRYIIILKTINDVIEMKKSSDVNLLDVGIVPGHLSYVLKEKYNINVHGISYKFENIFTQRMQAASIPIYKCDVEKDKFPFEDRAFNIVLCSELLEHLLFNPLHMLNEINRILENEGILILTTPNIARLENRIKLMFGKSINWPIDGDLAFFKRDLYDRHNREYTVDEITTMCKTTGFDVMWSKFFNYRKATDNNIKFQIYNILGKIYASDNILIVCKKRW